MNENNIELFFCNYSEKDGVNHKDKNTELFILTPSKMSDNSFKRRFNVYHYNDSDLKKNQAMNNTDTILLKRMIEIHKVFSY